jgi:fatty-acyl-CoA synthase
MSLFERLASQANITPDKTAIYHDGMAISYAQLYHRTQVFAAYIHREYQLDENDRIAFLSENHPDIFSLVFAASALRIVVVPLNWRLSNEELAYAISDAQPSVVLHSDAYSTTTKQIGSAQSVKHVDNWQRIVLTDHINTSLPTTSESDDFLLVYTSGTTGRPKGAVLNQTSLLSSGDMSEEAFSMVGDDVILCVLPLFHVGGLNIQALPGLLRGCTLVLQTAFTPNETITNIQQYKATQFLVVPTILAALLDHPDWQTSTLSTLRCLGIGSMDVPVRQLEQMHTMGVPVVQIYGATETGPVAIHQTIDNAFTSVGSIGYVGQQCQIRLLDDQRNDVKNGASGEIAVKGDNIFTRYWNNPAATELAMHQGWFLTGDVAKQDNNHLYWFTDRIKNVIISGGENIYAAEVERVLSTAEMVKEVAVIGLPDDRWGEMVVAVIVLTNADSDIKTTFAELHRHCANSLARFKLPKRYCSLDALPRNALGKIQTEALQNSIRSNVHLLTSID